MLLPIPHVLNADELADARRVLGAAEWVDGKVTAGGQSAQVKNNRQLDEHSDAAKYLRRLVLQALGRSALFLSAALPRRVFPPLFNNYEGGGNFGNHIDNAIRSISDTGERMRTDVSATLFFTGPDEYDGGELVVETSFGAQSVKLAAGDMVLYPATSLHHVRPVTRGARMASFFWVQSMVRDEGQRALLFDLDTSIQNLRARLHDDPEIVALTGLYHNLLRQWADA